MQQLKETATLVVCLFLTIDDDLSCDVTVCYLHNEKIFFEKPSENTSSRLSNIDAYSRLVKFRRIEKYASPDISLVV
jgi:hypothetical protein